MFSLNLIKPISTFFFLYTLLHFIYGKNNLRARKNEKPDEALLTLK